MWESANIKVHLTGKVVVTIGTQPQGQGHETTYAQIVAPRAGHPDGGRRRPALGHAGHAVRLRLVRQPDRRGRATGAPSRRPTRSARRRAGTRRTCSRPTPDDIEVDGANYRVKGSPDKVKTIQEIAFAIDLGFDLPEGMEPYLDETAYYDTPNCTWPFGTHIAIVEVDEETGARRPRALRRRRRRRQEDQPDDRRRPAPRRHRPGRRPGALGGRGLRRRRASCCPARCSTTRCRGPRGFPTFELDETVTPSPVNPLGVKGVGEAGAIASTRGGRQRRHRCAEPARHPPSRHAATRRRRSGAPSRLRREARHDPGGVRLPASGQPSTRRCGSSRSDGGAKVIAGGQSLLPLLKLRLATCRRRSSTSAGWPSSRASRQLADGRLVDRRADDLPRAARLTGAATTALLREVLPIIGDVQVRNRGTVGGSIAHADPASDLPAVPAGARRRDRRSGRPAASATVPIGGLLPGAVRDRHRDRRAADRDPAARRRATMPARPTSPSSSPRRATRWSAWRRSCRRRGPADHACQRRPDRRGRPRLPRDARSRRPWSARTARPRRSRPPPPTRPTACR